MLAHPFVPQKSATRRWSRRRATENAWEPSAELARRLALWDCIEMPGPFLSLCGRASVVRGPALEPLVTPGFG